MSLESFKDKALRLLGENERLRAENAELARTAWSHKAEAEALRPDAERWRLIERHWSAADIKNNRDGSFKSMTITFKATQLSDETNREKLRRAFDGATAKPLNINLKPLEL